MKGPGTTGNNFLFASFMQQLGGFTDRFAGLKYSDIAYVVTMDTIGSQFPLC